MQVQIKQIKKVEVEEVLINDFVTVEEQKSIFPEKRDDSFTGERIVYIEEKKAQELYWGIGKYVNGNLRAVVYNPAVVKFKEQFKVKKKNDEQNYIKSVDIDFSNLKRQLIWLPYPHFLAGIKELENSKYRVSYHVDKNVQKAPKQLVLEEYKLGENLGIMGSKEIMILGDENVLFRREVLPDEEFSIEEEHLLEYRIDKK